MGFACAAAVASGSAAGAAGLSIQELGVFQVRVKAIGYRIAAANSGTCARPQMMTGIVAHDLTQYLPAARPLVSRVFALNAGIGVLQVVPGSAADRAGLHANDEILAVGNRSVEDAAAIHSAPQSYAREDQFLAVLAAELAKGPTPLLVRRGRQLVRLTLNGERGCGGEVFLSDSSELNAWSDGSRVMITTAMVRQAGSDDGELAFVIAHEMAHNILGHSSGRNESLSLLGWLGFGSSRLRRMEGDADGFAVPLMDAAGYSPQASLRFLDTARRRMWWSDLSIDHPSFGRRIKIVTAAIARLPHSKAAYWPAQQKGGLSPAPKLVAYAEPRMVCGTAACVP
jgi:S1-C subfamily serine protease